MSTSASIDISNDQFKKYVIPSLVGHFIVVAIFTIKTVFFSGEPISYESAIRVDLVALPDKADPNDSQFKQPAEEEKPATSAAKKRAEKIANKNTVNLDKTKKKEQAALQKLKQLSALEAIQKQVENENTKKTLSKLKQYKGNELSSGTEVSGVARLQHDNYLALVEKHIKKNWSIPEWLANKNLKAQVRVRFDEHGNITAKDIFKSSGNPTFDEIAMTAVQNSSPVPPPPEKFVRILSIEGILLGFPE